MRKFSQINENKINESELESILNELSLEYQILHDYYFNSDTKSFFRDIQLLNEKSRYSKVIIISPKISKSSLNISDYDKDPMNFNSSGFYQFNNISDAKEKYNKVFDVINKLTNYSPNLIFKDNKFIITLLGENVDPSDVTLKDDMIKAKKQLFEDLKKFRSELNKPYFSVAYWNDLNYLYFNLVNFGPATKNIYGDYNGYEKTWERVVKTLEIQESGKKGKEWMNEVEEIEGLNDVRDNINNLGFYIKVIPLNDVGKFKLELEEI